VSETPAKSPENELTCLQNIVARLKSKDFLQKLWAGYATAAGFELLGLSIAKLLGLM